MAKSKAKWLAESNTRELVVLLKETLKEEDTKKANKIVTELLERIPEDDGNLTIEEAVEKAKSDLDAILEAYNQEVNSLKEPEEEEEDEEEEEEVKKPTKKRTRKLAKSSEDTDSDEDEEDEDEEEEDFEDEDEDEDEEDEGYEDMTQGELKKELRRRGIKVTKSMKKADMIRALEADDEE